MGERIESTKTVSPGVIQGSIFGPARFLIYINSLVTLDLTEKITMFAPTTTIIYSESSLRDLKIYMLNVHNKIESWLICNKLTLKNYKNSFMFITKIYLHFSKKSYQTSQ